MKTPNRGFKSKHGIVIICEDTKSNYFYLNKKVEETKEKNVTIPKPDFVLRNSGNVGGTQTDYFALYAIAEVEKLNRRYENLAKEIQELGEEDKKLEPEKNFFREIYIIADVDDNEYQHGKYVGKITDALNELATAEAANPIIKYKLLLSNECFEIWYILHFQDLQEPLYRGRGHTKHLANDSNLIRKRLGVLAEISVNEKKQKQRTDFFQIMQDEGNEAQAIERAKKLEADSKAKNPTEKFPSNPSTMVYVLIERLNGL